MRREPVDQAELARAGRSRSRRPSSVTGTWYCSFDVERAALPARATAGRAARPPARWHELERVGRVVDPRQHRRLEQQRQHLALLAPASGSSPSPARTCPRRGCPGSRTRPAAALWPGRGLGAADGAQRSRAAPAQPGQSADQQRGDGGRGAAAARRWRGRRGCARQLPQPAQRGNHDVQQQERGEHAEEDRRAVRTAQRRPGQQRPAENPSQRSSSPGGR